MDGPCGKLNLVLDEEPGCQVVIPTPTQLRNAQFTLVPWLEGAQRCYESARQGRVHERLWIDCLMPSLLDPSLVTPGGTS
jgi:phytoene dehydrogenase-like protein